VSLGHRVVELNRYLGLGPRVGRQQPPPPSGAQTRTDTNPPSTSHPIHPTRQGSRSFVHEGADLSAVAALWIVEKVALLVASLSSSAALEHRCSGRCSLDVTRRAEGGCPRISQDRPQHLALAPALVAVARRTALHRGEEVSAPLPLDAWVSAIELRARAMRAALIDLASSGWIGSQQPSARAPATCSRATPLHSKRGRSGAPRRARRQTRPPKQTGLAGG
jgi:hypothetical protein